MYTTYAAIPSQPYMVLPPYTYYRLATYIGCFLLVIMPGHLCVLAVGCSLRLYMYKPQRTSNAMSWLRYLTRVVSEVLPRCRT